MGGVVVGCLCGIIVLVMDFLLFDDTILNATKKMLSPAFESIGNLLFGNLLWRSEPQDAGAEPFVVSEYLARIEKASLEILESRKPVEQIVILWWGLDGLRLNEDGTLEWVSRRKPRPVQEDVVYQPFQSIQTYNPNLFAQMQNTRASINALMDQTASLQQNTRASINALMDQTASLQMQALQAQRTAQVINSLQQCCVQHPAQYPPYFYGGRCGSGRNTVRHTAVKSVVLSRW